MSSRFFPSATTVGVMLILSALLSMSCLPLTAQLTTADIVGTATDASGAVLPGVKVTVENLATNTTRTVMGDNAGDYSIPLLPPGRYSVKAELAHFKSWSVPEVTLAIGDRLRLDIHLDLGQIEQSVEVTAQTAALQSDSSSVGTLVNERAVQDLPLNGRNFVRLATLGAGANEGTTNGLASGNRPDDRRRSSSFQVNGQSDNMNNFLIDGMDNNERFIGSIIVRPSIDALAEFKLETNLYSAEIGRTAGGVVNAVTKSGSNTMHGSLFEFFRNEKLDAKNFFDPPGPTPAYKQNQFGGSLGGPIRKNKTFFFGDYEGLHLRQGLTFASTVPTAAMIQGNFAGVATIFDPLTNHPDPNHPGVTLRNVFPNNQIPGNRIDRVALNLLNLYPAPIFPGLVNNFSQSPVKTQRDDTFDTKIDHQFSPKDTFFARYSFNNTDTLLPPQLPKKGNIEAGGDRFQFAGPSTQRSQGLHLNHVHIFRPNLLAEFKAGFARFAIATLPPNYGNNVSQTLGIPGANVDADSSGLTPMVVAGYRGLGDSNYIPILTINNVFQYVGKLTYVRAAHTFKSGVDFRRRQTSPFQSPQSKGTFIFDGNFTNDPSGIVKASGNSIASMLLGFPSSTVRSKYLVSSPGWRNSEISAFVQDDWRVNHWLTLNLGLRYDIYTPQYEVTNRISNVDLATGKIIIAGQNGVSRSAGVAGDYNNFAPRFGFAATPTQRTVIRGGIGLNYYPISFGSGYALRNPPFVNLYAIDATPITPINTISQGFPLPTPIDPLNPSGSLTTVARDIVNPYVIQYNLTAQRELFSGLVVSVGYVAALSRKQVESYDINLALPGAGAIVPRRQYYSMFPKVAAISQLSSWGTSDFHSLQVTAEHRLRAGLNLSSNYTWGHLIDDFPNGSGKVGRGPFPQLVTNRRLERGNSDIDIRHRFVVMVNYELPFGKTLKGPAAMLAKGWQMNAIGILQSGPTLTVQNGANQSNTGGGDRPNQLRDANLPSDQRSLNHWFDTSAFVAQPLYTIGDAGRNTVFGPGRESLDFSLFKDFSIRERMTLQFRAEAFNITNTPNFEVPGNQLGTSSFGVVSSTGNTLPRNLQFALKLLF